MDTHTHTQSQSQYPLKHCGVFIQTITHNSARRSKNSNIQKDPQVKELWTVAALTSLLTHKVWVGILYKTRLSSRTSMVAQQPHLKTHEGHLVGSSVPEGRISMLRKAHKGARPRHSQPFDWVHFWSFHGTPLHSCQTVPPNQARAVLKETWSWVKVVLKVKGDMVLDLGQEFICREIIWTKFSLVLGV